MKVLIAGARGMLGHDLTEVFSQALGAKHVVALDSKELDITSPDSISTVLSSSKPTIVINAAAYTNVDKAESEVDLAFALNTTGPALLAESCARRGAKLIHFSTDQVFDGSGSTPWREIDAPRPLNEYARTKLEGEGKVLSHPAHLVLRVQWLYGKQKDRFSPLRTKETFTPFNDQFGAPTWTVPLSETVLRLARGGVSGLYHYSYDDFASWFEVYQFVVSEWKLSTRLIPKRSEEIQLPAKRPRFAVLDNHKLLTALGQSSLGSWREPLSRFLRQMVQ